MRYWVAESDNFAVYYRGVKEPIERRGRWGDGKWTEWEEADIRDRELIMSITNEISEGHYLMLRFQDTSGN